MHAKFPFAPSRIVRGCLLACFLASGATAFADTIYTSQAAFDAAVTGRTAYTFPNGVANQALTMYTLGPVTFSSTTTRGGIFFEGDGGFGSTTVYLTVSEPSLDLSLMPGATSIGITLGTFDSDGQLDIIVNGQTYTESFLREQAGFFGIVSPTPITSLSINQTANYTSEYDVLSFELAGAPSPVPEPATLTLLASGAATLLAGRRLRRNR